MRYVVIELQDLGGQVGNSVVMLNKEGQYIKSESYKHEQGNEE